MQILISFPFFVVERHKSLLLSFLGFFSMELATCLNKFSGESCLFGCGFFVLGCVQLPHVFYFLGLFFICCLAMKVCEFSMPTKCLIQFLTEFGGKQTDSKTKLCQCISTNFLKSSSKSVKEDDESLASKELMKKQNSNNVNPKYQILEEEDEEKDFNYEDEEFNVKTLRKLVKIERHRKNVGRAELEKERMAAASAAEEAMAMILRLQNEKSMANLQAKQYRRMAEQKQQYDEKVIQYLQRIVVKHESERSLMEDQLRLCRQKLKLLLKNSEDGFDDDDVLDTSFYMDQVILSS